jgi:tRNA (guanine-N7-)-methyltransferase
MLLQPEARDIPIDPVHIFDREAPVAAEIGCGSGYFLTEIAGRRPAVNFLAAERHSASVRRSYNRIRQKGLTNVRIYHGEGRFFLRNLVPPDGLTALWANFPDPWPGTKNIHNRLFQTSFFRLLAARLGRDGRVYLTTDHNQYFTWACARGRESGYFDLKVQAPPSIVLKSRYAQKWQSEGRSIHHVVFTRTRSADVERTLELVPMQHSVLEGEFPDLNTFESVVHAFDDNHVVVKGILRPVDGRAVYFEVHLEEEGLTQDILLRLRQRNDSNRMVLGVDPFGHPIATRGVAEAVGVVTDWLVGQGLTVVDSSY